MILRGVEMGRGAPVVLLHGLLGQARNFGVVQRRLAESRRVIALDLRNHGGSPHESGMSYADMAGDVAETLAAMGALPAAVIGHSMGGKVAMALALTRPDAVARLMVVDIAPVANPPRFGPLLTAMRDLPLRPGMTRGEAEAGLAAAVPEAGLRAFLMQNFVPGAAPGWRVGLGRIIAGMDEILGWPRFAGTYDGPALFLAGERSDYLLAEHRAGIRALFTRARFATLKGAGHWVHADNPEGFVGVAAAFLG